MDIMGLPNLKNVVNNSTLETKSFILGFRGKNAGLRAFCFFGAGATSAFCLRVHLRKELWAGRRGEGGNFAISGLPGLGDTHVGL